MMQRLLYKLRSLAQVGESLQTLASLAVDLRDQLRGHQMQLDVLYTLVKEPRPPARWVTVLLFWQRSPSVQSMRDGSPAPGFASTTLLVQSDRVSSHFQLMEHVPPGAWLVAVGAHLETVLVGNDLQDMNMPDRSPMVQLHHAVSVGMQIRFTLRPIEPS